MLEQPFDIFALIGLAVDTSFVFAGFWRLCIFSRVEVDHFISALDKIEHLEFLVAVVTVEADELVAIGSDTELFSNHVLVVVTVNGLSRLFAGSHALHVVSHELLIHLDTFQLLGHGMEVLVDVLGFG